MTKAVLKRKGLDFFAQALVALIFFGITLVGVTYIQAVFTKIGADVLTPDPIHVIAGESFNVCHKFDIPNNTELLITRFLEKQLEDNKGNKYTFILATDFNVISKKKGIYNKCRSMYVPETAPLGDYTLEVVITANHAPFWKIKHPAKSLKVVVE